ncbi:2-keto-4-pentenoate hydratase/2-oxohepta-3-ene-1,7-dioic acid hydratase (catechol pathway) [Cribrihabitans marinus]|uniref:2-keto-4-pentenoate hydratase/2-oxohepta-3-ene-1,7-dioic acid hydratase (Catechol pathway) n=1 Tax=Cribrihabitans marinus TaxID=1227549 RepID=A0A1H6SBS9_9RHOB|nr:fumarylacetoacetate hydrolase family protein [Cribrihabitans marinus]GGH23627.1 2-hydroxyhepta-2,4-diene-1,7-dioate isomerase [Cribrihabitans marinus]SEI65463.1 2-keto-4-pentenoate hydratase/2-oxohepta-3-ene-1,7-dioic acid hydratase (catechol pathway) [Cribrihabitans marinus]
MKLLRYRDGGRIRPGLLDGDGQVRDLSDHVDDLDGAALSPQSLGRLAALDPDTLPKVDGAPDLAPCIGGVGKYVCIGLNYSDHAAELGMEHPEHPVVFLKATSAISGPNDDIVQPRGASTTDWEVELGIVIGTAAKYVSEDEAMSHVAGFCVLNDVSERDFQMRLGGQWTKGKSCDSFGPMGPWLVTRDEVADPHALELTCEVNGDRMQHGNSANMIFSLPRIVSHLSQLMTLHPGDVIATGTPAGVGGGRKPPVFLKPGDVLRTAISGLGEMVQTVRSDG